jgi:hypothetical protein
MQKPEKLPLYHLKTAKIGDHIRVKVYDMETKETKEKEGFIYFFSDEHVCVYYPQEKEKGVYSLNMDSLITLIRLSWYNRVFLWLKTQVEKIKTFIK